MRRRARPSLRSSRVTLGDSISPRLVAHERLTAPSAGATQLAHRSGGSGHRVLGPLARPITRMQPAVAPASPLAVSPAADPPPRSAYRAGRTDAPVWSWGVIESEMSHG